MGREKCAVLIKKGAEANLYRLKWHGRKAVLKKRLPKKYRSPALDKLIRTYRTVHEPQLLHAAKEAGVSTPMVFLVQVKKAEILMEFIGGKQIKLLLNKVNENQRKRLCETIGGLVGRLHRAGIVHGDLTTSNMILNSEGRIFLVDFGLGERTNELEARAVDLHLFKRTLQSTHFLHADKCFASVMKGYREIVGEGPFSQVLTKVAEIERRGRYVSERKA